MAVDCSTIKPRFEGRLLNRPATRKINGPGCYVFACSAPRRGRFPCTWVKATKNILNDAFKSDISPLNHFLLNCRNVMVLFAAHQQTARPPHGNSKSITGLRNFSPPPLHYETPLLKINGTPLPRGRSRVNPTTEAATRSSPRSLPKR